MSRAFDGVNDELTIASNAALRPSLPVTIAGWIHPDASGAAIFTNNKVGTTHCGVWLELSGLVVAASYGDNTGTGGSGRRSKTAVTSIGLDAWHHIAATIRGATDMSIYLDGVDDGGSYTGTGGALAYNTSNGGRIGSIAGTIFTDGEMAEVAFWSVSLGSAEIAALAKGLNPLMLRQGNLIGYWPILGTASPEPDYSGRGRTATVSGATPATRHAPVMPFVFPTIPGELGRPSLTFDEATVRIDISVYVTEEYPVVPFNISVSSVEVFESVDAATVYINISNTGGECYSTATAINLGEGEANLEWYEDAYVAEWSAEATPEWSYGNTTAEAVC